RTDRFRRPPPFFLVRRTPKDRRRRPRRYGMRAGKAFRGLLLGAALAVAASGRAANAAPAGPRVAPRAPIAATSRRSHDEFGIGDYAVTVIPAASFTSDDSYVSDYGSLSRYFPPDDSHHLYYAGLSQVPSGAIIDYVGLECHSGFAGELTATPF